MAMVTLEHSWCLLRFGQVWLRSQQQPGSACHVLFADAAAGDPMGGCCVTSAGFSQMTALMGTVAPLAVILEVPPPC